MLRRCVTSAKCFKSVGAPRGAVQLLYDSAERCYDSTVLFAIDWNIVKIFPFVSTAG